jgi:hypothetical protein
VGDLGDLAELHRRAHPLHAVRVAEQLVDDGLDRLLAARGRLDAHQPLAELLQLVRGLGDVEAEVFLQVAGQGG